MLVLMSGLPMRNVALGLTGLGIAAAVGYHNDAFLPQGYKPWFCWNPSTGWGFDVPGSGGGDGADAPVQETLSTAEAAKKALCPFPSPAKPVNQDA